MAKRISPSAVTDLTFDYDVESGLAGDAMKHPSNNDVGNTAKRAKTEKAIGSESVKEQEAPGKSVNFSPSSCKHCGCHYSWPSMVKNHGRCLTCGRITVPYTQQKPYRPPQSGLPDYNFGERTIGFRIVPRDPRQEEKYNKNWKEADKNDPQWQYSEAAMKQSVIDFKLGRLPSLKIIMSIVGEWKEEKLIRKNRDAIILDDDDDIALLRILHKVGIGSNKPNAEGYSESLYSGDITATWDPQTESGSFKIRLFLPGRCAKENHRRDDHALFLGCWFKVFPLKLESISGTVKASMPQFYGNERPSPADMGAVEATVSNHNKKVDQFVSSLTLTSSCGGKAVGGYASNDISLRGVLERFYKERFSHAGFANVAIKKSSDWKKLSNHKDGGPRDHDFVLSHSDRRFAALCLKKHTPYSNGFTTQHMMAQLESLGHEPELTCEGLNVELLEFQKQSLRWAMEREMIAGGIQSYFWVKVPIEGLCLYFNPVLGRFRKDKPKTVRGGIIAEEMGLGKTIISLALILKHPAPAFPISGSPISSLATISIGGADSSESNGLQWDADLYSETSTENKLRGSVLSRATLVVCPVSLVGQWIEEAKSKLSNPGLLYPYHGGNRIRNPEKLAENAIVVTTYQIIASDDTYHRNKSSNPDKYCPPLEQVRWWRIICDEGHSLRDGYSQKNWSLSKLVADNKWVVTGTPVSTSMLDLRSQLRLIGVENVYKMFDGAPRNRYDVSENALSFPGNMRFLMRNVMIRHTQKQVYRGTNTTLMSLPPKTERLIEVVLSDAERKEYDALDQAARNFYIQFKANHSRELSKNYLLLSQQLTPQRVACAGGRPPFIPEAGNAEEGDDSEGETDLAKKNKAKLSDFCFTSKLMALIEELKQARDTDPTSKSLVFTQFNTTLDLLMKELPNHGFQFRTLSGNMSMKKRAKALHDFQSDPPTTVFLLSMRSGNCGINLTQANRVFLMEPGFNPALEKQAIGRVHRLGQKRNVEIIRLLVKDSIETRISKFLETKYGVRVGSDEGPAKEQKVSDSKRVENEAFEIIGNLATERPKNKMITSEFDLLFGVKESESEALNPSTRDVAMPEAAISSDFL